MATLIGYGAAAINPYLMFESLDELAVAPLLQHAADRQHIAVGPGVGPEMALHRLGRQLLERDTADPRRRAREVLLDELVGCVSALSNPTPVLGQELNQTPAPWANFGFAGAWDSTKGYAPLTLVTYNGVRYAARLRPNALEPTPVGAEPDQSPDIWAPLPAR